MKKYLYINNRCNVAISWKFTNALLNKINIVPTYGYIKPNNKNEVVFTYMSNTIEEIKPIKLNIEVSDIYNSPGEICKNSKGFGHF